ARGGQPPSRLIAPLRGSLERRIGGCYCGGGCQDQEPWRRWAQVALQPSASVLSAAPAIFARMALRWRGRPAAEA
ncbi:unnamed protein product, partial [Symbiodinium necroappetens]